MFKINEEQVRGFANIGVSVDEALEALQINERLRINKRLQIQEITLRIQAILPGASTSMIDEYSQTQEVGLETVRIWAAQGLLRVVDGAIVKTSSHLAIPHDEIRKVLAQLVSEAKEERWATDPLNLMPYFSRPQMAIATFLRAIADGLNNLADCINP